jgi:hypothetical protein
MKNISDIAAVTRIHRILHRWFGSVMIVILIIVSGTGLLLGWKKNSNGFLLAENRQGTSTDMSRWQSMDSLHRSAIRLLRDSVDPALSQTTDRIDVRPEKGMVKFTFKGHFHAIQIDAATGHMLSTEIRRADWIEKLHDGSILDQYLISDGQPFKLTYTTITSVGLMLLSFTGFWLWYNPRRIRRRKEKSAERKIT